MSLKIRYILSCYVEVRQSRLNFFWFIKLLWRVFGTARERNNTCVELSRPLWNSQSALVSIRILPDLVSSSPFPSSLSRFFVLEPPKRDLGTRSFPNSPQSTVKTPLGNIFFRRSGKNFSNLFTQEVNL